MSDYHLQQLAAASASVPGGDQGQTVEGVQAAATAAALAAPSSPATSSPATSTSGLEPNSVSCPPETLEQRQAPNTQLQDQASPQPQTEPQPNPLLQHQVPHQPQNEPQPNTNHLPKDQFPTQPHSAPHPHTLQPDHPPQQPQNEPQLNTLTQEVPPHHHFTPQPNPLMQDQVPEQLHSAPEQNPLPQGQVPQQPHNQPQANPLMQGQVHQQSNIPTQPDPLAQGQDQQQPHNPTQSNPLPQGQINQQHYSDPQANPLSQNTNATQISNLKGNNEPHFQHPPHQQQQNFQQLIQQSIPSIHHNHLGVHAASHHPPQYTMAAPATHHGATGVTIAGMNSVATIAPQSPGMPPLPLDPADVEKKYHEKCAECSALRHDLEIKMAEIRKLKQELYKKQSVKLKSAPTTDMSGEGITIDVDIGPSSSRTRSYDQRWKSRFQDLVKYKLQHGDCIVPKSYKDKALHSWVRKQRILKKDFDLGLASDESMTQERVNALNSIGFAWVVGHQSNEPQWETNFQALVVFKSQYGHTRVPQSYDKTLHKWVLNQRCRRRLLEEKGEGKAKGMTWGRIEKLDAIDFAWSGKK